MDKIQEKSLHIARYFIQFCQTHNLRCFVCGGGLIGALRHKGFIPWDDDLDFFMPRKDYEQLLVLWAQHADKRYVLYNSNRTLVDRNLFVTIRDSQTTCIKGYQQDLDLVHGLALDVLPLDYYPKKPLQRRFQVMWALIYSLFKAQTVPEKHGGLMAFGSRVLLACVPFQAWRYRIWRYAEKRMTRYTKEDSDGITELCSGPYYMKKKYPLDAFDTMVYLPFEQTTLPAPNGYHNYLTIAFGDYMQLPPIEKQKAHHDNVVLALDTPYALYQKD